MRNFALGFVVAALLFCAFPVYGAVSSLIGEKIDGEYVVVVDGVELQDKAIVVNGKSFTPNRAIGDAVGYNVSFQDGKIIFSAKEEKTVSVVNDVEQEEKLVELNKLNIRKYLILERVQELRTTTTNIKEKLIPEYQSYKESVSPQLGENFQKIIDELENDYSRYMQELTQLEEQLNQIDEQIRELQQSQ